MDSRTAGQLVVLGAIGLLGVAAFLFIRFYIDPRIREKPDER